MRIAAPQPWSYDEYYHLGLAREMRSDFRVEAFRWTPFSVLYDRFADKEPLFHVLLMPFALLLVGFSVVVLALLAAEASWKVLAPVCALFGLVHAGGWIAIVYATLCGVVGHLSRRPTEPSGRCPPTSAWRRGSA